jgi:hypothetical protein
VGVGLTTQDTLNQHQAWARAWDPVLEPNAIEAKDLTKINIAKKTVTFAIKEF